MFYIQARTLDYICNQVLRFCEKMLCVICFDTFAYPQLYFIFLEEKMQAQIN